MHLLLTHSKQPGCVFRLQPASLSHQTKRVKLRTVHSFIFIVSPTPYIDKSPNITCHLRSPSAARKTPPTVPLVSTRLCTNEHFPRPIHINTNRCGSLVKPNQSDGRINHLYERRWVKPRNLLAKYGVWMMVMSRNLGRLENGIHREARNESIKCAAERSLFFFSHHHRWLVKLCLAFVNWIPWQRRWQWNVIVAIFGIDDDDEDEGMLLCMVIENAWAQHRVRCSGVRGNAIN